MSGLCSLLAAAAMPQTVALAQGGGFASGGSGLIVKASIVDSAGAPLEQAAAGADFKVVLSFTEALQGRPATGLKPVTWVRRIAPGGTSCTNAAWIVRATGAIAPDDIALERSFLVAVGADAVAASSAEDRLRVLDLDHRLKSANQLSVTPLGGPILALLVHPTSPRAFVLRAGADDVVAVDLPWGGLQPVAAGFDRPHLLSTLGGNLVVADRRDGGRLVEVDPAGMVRAQTATGSQVRTLAKPAGDTLLGVLADGSAVLLGPGEKTTKRFAPGSFPGSVAAGGGLIVAAMADRGLMVRWQDDPERAVPLPLDFAADGLFVRDDGRYVVAWSTAAPKAVVVDLARARVVAAPAVPDIVHEVASAGAALFLTHGSVPAVTVVDLAPLAAEASPVERRVRLPLPDGPVTGVPNAGRLVATPATASVLAVRPGSNVAFAIAAGGGLSDAPMSAVTIRGDLPKVIARFDRRLVETAPGRFEAPLRLARGGTYEIVTTTGVGGTTACASFRVDGPGADEKPPAALRVLAEPPRAAEPGKLVLALENRPDWLTDGPLVMRIDDLAFGWSQRFRISVRKDAPIELDVVFPRQGRYAVSVESSGGRIVPLTVDVD
ncbi:MAG: hypothetical protein ABS35_30395 [Kaistia sp. SCN 65-12]|nr:MAG: hypothetical protein ABS35_30395 [Kaistia sp. SCN 65-12]